MLRNACCRYCGELKRLIALVGLACVLGSETWAQPQFPPPLVGFSFSPKGSELASRDPGSDLRRLLSATQPDLVRLPIYWDAVQPSPDELDFSSIDELLEIVAQHNLTAADPTRVVLAIGARNFLYPELHQPPWAGPREQPPSATRSRRGNIARTLCLASPATATRPCSTRGRGRTSRSTMSATTSRATRISPHASSP